MAVTNIFTNPLVNRTARREASVAAHGRSTVAFSVVSSEDFPVAYDVNDVLMDYLNFPDCARANGGSGQIRQVCVNVSDTWTVSDTFDLLLFSGTPSSNQINNTALSLTILDYATQIATLSFTSSDAKTLVSGTHVTWNKEVTIPYVCNADTSGLVGLVVLRGPTTLTTVDSEVFQVSLGIEID